VADPNTPESGGPGPGLGLLALVISLALSIASATGLFGAAGLVAQIAAVLTATAGGALWMAGRHRSAPEPPPADRDRLTGLLYRRAFERAAAALLSVAARRELPMVLAQLRIEGLTSLDAEDEGVRGDAALAALGAIARGKLRSTDLAARLDGVNLCLLLTDTTTAGAAIVTERLKTQFGAYCHEQGIELSLRVAMEMISPDVGELGALLTTLKTRLEAGP